jgi:glycerol-3-phosphate acyltransferase PlsY
VGKVEGILTWALDAAKGAGAMALADKVFSIPMFWVVIAGVAAVAGHCWSIFLKFKGGKGASTTGGVLLYIVPKIVAVAILFYFLLQIKKLRTWWMILIGVGIFWYLGWLFYRNEGRWLLWSILILIGLGVIINIPTIKEFIQKKKL